MHYTNCENYIIVFLSKQYHLKVFIDIFGSSFKSRIDDFDLDVRMQRLKHSSSSGSNLTDTLQYVQTGRAHTHVGSPGPGKTN